MSIRFFKELLQTFESIRWNTQIKCVILSGGDCRMFTAGLDLTEITGIPGSQKGKDSNPSREALDFLPMIKLFQETFTSIETCNKPVIAAIHGECIGGGIDLITACDMRYASSDASFCVKEIDVGLAADVGTLQRLPKVVGNQSWVREITFTARTVPAKEALEFGLIHRILPDKDALTSNLLFFELKSL